MKLDFKKLKKVIPIEMKTETEPEVTAIFAEMSPFEIGTFDERRKTIVVEKKFKRTKTIVDLIYDHEDAHSKSKKKFDWDVESEKAVPLKYYKMILRKKPLWLFAPFVPLIGYKNDGRWHFGWDYTRVVNDFILFFCLLATILAISTIFGV